MARPQRNNVDYFPHLITHGKKMHIIRSRYGNDGYAVWFMLLEELGRTNYHYLDLSDEIQLMYLAETMKVNEEVLLEIINLLVKMGEFDADFWQKNSIIYSSKFIEHIIDAYKKRSNDCLTKFELIAHLESLGVLKPSLGGSIGHGSGVSTPVNPQRKEKKRKGKERRGKEMKEDEQKPPPISDQFSPKNPPKKSLDVFPDKAEEPAPQLVADPNSDRPPDFGNGLDAFRADLKIYLSTDRDYQWSPGDSRMAKEIFLKLKESYPGDKVLEAFKKVYKSLDSFHSKNQDYSTADMVIKDFDAITFKKISAIIN